MNRMTPFLGRALPFIALSLIGTGVGFIYWPAALIVVGVILLLDLYLKG